MRQLHTTGADGPQRELPGAPIAVELVLGRRRGVAMAPLLLFDLLTP